MHIDKHNICLLTQAGNFRLGGHKRIVQFRHENAPLKIEHRDRRQSSRSKHVAAAANRCLRIIQRSQKTGFFAQQSRHLFLVPEMIAACDHIHSGRENFVGRLGGDARSPGRIFAIGNDEVDPVADAQFRQQRLNGLPPRFAYDIADEQNLHLN